MCYASDPRGGARDTGCLRPGSALKRLTVKGQPRPVIHLPWGLIVVYVSSNGEACEPHDVWGPNRDLEPAGMPSLVRDRLVVGSETGRRKNEEFCSLLVPFWSWKRPHTFSRSSIASWLPCLLLIFIIIISIHINKYSESSSHSRSFGASAPFIFPLNTIATQETAAYLLSISLLCGAYFLWAAPSAKPAGRKRAFIHVGLEGPWSLLMYSLSCLDNLFTWLLLTLFCPNSHVTSLGRLSRTSSSTSELAPFSFASHYL